MYEVKWLQLMPGKMQKGRFLLQAFTSSCSLELRESMKEIEWAI